MKSKVFLFLFLGILLNLTLRVYIHREQYLTKYDPEYWHDRYLKSQWVTPNSKESIGDDGLYAYGGWEYIHGSDPSLLNPEMPPLGKLIIGTSIAIFGNPNVQALIFGLGALVFLYHLSRLLMGKTLSLLAVYLFTLEPVFADQLTLSLLDLQELVFLLASVFFFMKFLKSKKNIPFFLSFLFLGAMMSVKFYLVALLLAITYFSVLMVINKRLIFKFFLFSPTILVIYLFSYTGYFLNSHSLREFLALQKWVVVFHKSSLAFAFPGGPFWMMLFNRWESWFGGLWYRDHVIISAPDWQITWSIIFLLTAVATLEIIRRRDSLKTYHGQIRLIFSAWIIIYFFFLSFIPIFPRYLILAIPIMYTLSLDLLFNLNFLNKLLIFFKKEMKYKKSYLFMILFISFILFLKIPKVESGEFIFSPQFAHDLIATRNVIFGLTPITEPPPFEILKTLYLSVPYFLSDGNPQTLVILLTFIPFLLALFFYYFFRRKSQKLMVITMLLTSSLFFIFYQLFWDISFLSTESLKELFYKNETEILDFTYKDSKVFRFAVLPVNNQSVDDHYRFLYQWWETRRYRGKNLPVGDNEMQILYVIFNPDYEIISSRDTRKKFEENYKVKFRFSEKFSSGIIVWKFDRLDKIDNNETVIND